VATAFELSERALVARMRRARGLADLVFVGFGLAVGIGLAAPVVDGTLAEVHTPGGPVLAISTVTGLVGTILAWIMVVLAARVPALERAVGQPKVMRWHRAIAPWAIGFILAHVIAAIGAAALAAHTSFASATVQTVTSSAALVEATVAAAVIVVVGAISVPRVRTRIPRERWWLVHVTLYAALGLAVLHEVALGPSFVTHPAARVVWIAAWLAAAAGVLAFRVLGPLLRSRRLALSVSSVRELADGRFVEVCVDGHAPLPRLGGQYLLWRFHDGARVLEAHPFTVLPGGRETELRLVARRVGDFTDRLAHLPVGTRVSIEGPYGAFTIAERTERRSVLVAGGAGQTAICALLGDLGADAEPVVVVRASEEADVVLREELERLVAARRGRLRVLVGSRGEVPLRTIFDGIDRLDAVDVWIAGPSQFVVVVSALARQLGVRQRSLHADPYAI
jgi:predicted ferric reductase